MGIMVGVLTTVALAQDAGVSLKVDLVAWGDDIQGLSLKPGPSNAGLTAKAFRYSVPISYSGPALMGIYQGSAKSGEVMVAQSTPEDKDHEMAPMIPEANPSAKASPQRTALALELEKRRKKDPSLVALAQLPAGSRHATVLLAPEDGGTYRAYVIDDDPAKLPLGQLRIHNLSPHTIAMRINGAPPQEIKTRETISAPAKDQQAIYELAYKLGDEWKFQESNILPVTENEQTQLIILRSDNRFFLSTDGASGGFLQAITLRRNGR